MCALRAAGVGQLGAAASQGAARLRRPGRRRRRRRQPAGGGRRRLVDGRPGDAVRADGDKRRRRRRRRRRTRRRETASLQPNIAGDVRRNLQRNKKMIDLINASKIYSPSGKFAERAKPK